MTHESEKALPLEYSDWKRPDDDIHIQSQRLQELDDLIEVYDPQNPDGHTEAVLRQMDGLKEAFSHPELLRKSLLLSEKLDKYGPPEIQNRNRDIFFQSMSTIEGHLVGQEDTFEQRGYTHRLNNMLLNGTYPQLTAAREALYSRLPLFEKMFLQGDFEGNFVGWTQMMLMTAGTEGRDDRREQLRETLLRLCIQEEDGNLAIQPGLSYMIQAIDTKVVEVDEVAKSIVSEVFAKIENRFGISGSKLETVWRSSCRSVEAIEKNYILMSNLQNMTTLDRRLPGSPKTLYERFGILCFSRYPIELLQEQYLRKDERGKPYGAVLFPYSDHNGAFYSDATILKKLRADLGSSAYLRITEGGSKIDIVKHMRHMRRWYGPMSFAIVGAHGQRHGFEFGEGDDPKFSLIVPDLYDEYRGAMKMEKEKKKFFIENPTLILASCSTGQTGGMAETLSKLFHATVIAPNAVTGLESIRAKQEDGKWKFNVRYGDVGVERRFQAGKIEP